MAFSFIPQASGGGGTGVIDPEAYAEIYHELHQDTLSSSSSGTGAAVSVNNATTFSANGVNDGRPGVYTMSTGTTTTGRSNLYYSHLAQNLSSGGGEVAITHKQSVVLSALSDGTDTYIAGWGMSNQQTTIATQKSGCYFLYDTDGYDGNIRAVIDDNGSQTVTDTGIAMDTSYHYYEIVVADDHSSVTFKIDGASVASPVTTNLTVTRNWNMNCGIYKSAGTTARTISTDYFYTRWAFTGGVRPDYS